MAGSLHRLAVGIALLVGSTVARAQALSEFEISGPPTLDIRRYGFRNLVDGTSKRAWCVGKEVGPKASIRFQLEPAVSIARIEIEGGYFKNESVFRANRRLKTARIVLDNGSASVAVAFDDVMKPVVVSVSPAVPAFALRLELLELYGDEQLDLCISEIRIFPAGAKRSLAFLPSEPAAAPRGLHMSSWTADGDERIACDFRIDPPNQLIPAKAECRSKVDPKVEYTPGGGIVMLWIDRYQRCTLSNECAPPEGEGRVTCIACSDTLWYRLQ